MGKHFMKLVTVSIIPCLTAVAPAAIDYSTAGSVYQQDFNTLASAGTANPWTNNVTLPGFYAFHSGATSTAAGIVRGSPDNIEPTNWIAVNDYRTSGGSSSRIYAWGHATIDPSDRALGSLAGSVGTSDPGDFFYGLVLRNTTGETLTSFTLTYTGEQWFDQLASSTTGPVGPHTLVFSYLVKDGFDANADIPTQNNFGSYTLEPSLNFVSPTTGNTSTTSVQSLNGNLDENRGTISATIAVDWAPDQYLILRFWDDDDSGNDQPHGIDDLSFSATSDVIPEPGTAGVLVAATASMLISRRRRS